ncbi:small nuclear ribonucleoprotein, partial [Toxoplasma gondii RUB]
MKRDSHPSLSLSQSVSSASFRPAKRVFRTGTERRADAVALEPHFFSSRFVNMDEKIVALNPNRDHPP